MKKKKEKEMPNDLEINGAMGLSGTTRHLAINKVNFAPDSNFMNNPFGVTLVTDQKLVGMLMNSESTNKYVSIIPLYERALNTDETTGGTETGGTEEPVGGDEGEIIKPNPTPIGNGSKGGEMVGESDDGSGFLFPEEQEAIGHIAVIYNPTAYSSAPWFRSVEKADEELEYNPKN